jgi:hypothetical protein
MTVSGFGTGTSYNVTLPLFGSIFPSTESPNEAYQANPSGSTTTSCGWWVRWGRSYSV